MRVAPAGAPAAACHTVRAAPAAPAVNIHTEVIASSLELKIGVVTLTTAVQFVAQPTTTVNPPITALNDPTPPPITAQNDSCPMIDSTAACQTVVNSQDVIPVDRLALEIPLIRTTVAATAREGAVHQHQYNNSTIVQQHHVLHARVLNPSTGPPPSPTERAQNILTEI